MAFYVLFVCVIFCILMSLRVLFLPRSVRSNPVSLENFFMLAMLYATIMIGFGLLYMMLEMKGFQIIVDGSEMDHISFFTQLKTYIYFSGMTLFSVGYGDITPIGIGRLIAINEALIGHTIAAAFVARAVFDRE
ncbi:two pore domain potassium channel family protein [Bacillus sp. DNRA2]|uniref:two pore domain potassium channel family protein n=1 Tax=Bacillus sp. DNRA2 TaxID=2723053 RepID=UPI00145F7D6B|nr:two pore domain potassium channel family protein [Bacillus sp. DNRA2]NMD71402.1 two pore domain potassium channel family protein [Bacillus sp. DNRA2]